MRIIGPDIHRAFAEAVAWDDGKLKRLGRVDARRPLLEAFAKLSKEDVVVVEAAGNAVSVAAVIAPHVGQVVIANQSRCASSLMRRSRPIRSTPASSLNCMQAAFCRKSGYLMSRPERFADGDRRNQIIRQRSRWRRTSSKSILPDHLIPSCPRRSVRGSGQAPAHRSPRLAEDRRLAVERHLREFDRHAR